MLTGNNVYKRKDGRWEARYLKGRRQNKTIIYGSCYGKTYQEAKQKAELARSKILANSTVVGKTLADTEQVSIGDLCNRYLYMNQFRIKPSTYAKYRNIVEKHIQPFLGNSLLEDITTEQLAAFTRDLQLKKGLKEKNDHRYFVSLKYNFEIRIY